VNTKNVRNRKWRDPEILYDDGDFSAIWGYYDEGKEKVLGLRWNGEDGSLGFPQTSAHPTWFVIPNGLTRMNLMALLECKLRHNDADASVIVDAIREFESQGGI